MTAPNDTAALQSHYVQRLRRLDACAVSDAMDRLKLSGVVSGIPQASGEDRIAGVVVTLQVGIGDAPPGPARHLGTTAIESAGADHVIAVEQTTGIDAGCWGGLLTMGAKMRGVAGVVADGPVRDIDEARTYDFPIFTRTLTALTARGRVVEKGTNGPITLWGIPVAPGDYVIADRSAVVFIHRSDIERVLEVAETIATREATMAKALLSGMAPSAVMAGNYEHMLKE